MCGIVGAIAQRDVAPILIEGLRRLEYRGYDSAGIAVLDAHAQLDRVRTAGKVDQLAQALAGRTLNGHLGIAHTRWATHGKPSESNAHPHICRNRVAIVHNGIIENHDELRANQNRMNFPFTSETDSEVIVHQIYHYLESGLDLLESTRRACGDFKGAYALAVISVDDPERLVAVRQGIPLVVGIGIGEYFVASDVAALLPVTQRFIFLQDGDSAEASRDGLTIRDAEGRRVERPEQISVMTADSVERGPYRHYMLKEIHEQPRAIADTLEGRVAHGRVLEQAFGVGAGPVFDTIKGVHILACGTSYHAGLIGRYWLEAIAGIPCNVEVASEFRYRKPVVRGDWLILTLSQSGETADTLAALREAKRLGFGQSLAVCNVAESALVRESDLTLLTRAGPEIGVASTKAFTSQLVALMLLVIALARRTGLSADAEMDLVQQLERLPRQVEDVLALDPQIEALAARFTGKHNALFLGRGAHFPVAMEGALKLKEISYIHAEAYPAGELKHGPLALVDADMPVIAVAPNNELLKKLKSNLQEVSTRGGRMIVFADENAGMTSGDNVTVLPVAPTADWVAPIIFTVPLQLLAYHVAVLKGTDLDKPRNLAKAVTVE